MAGYVKCQKSKEDRYSRQTKLVLMSTGRCSFKEIAMNVVAELPDSEVFNAILVITDQFPKVWHCMLAKTT